MDHPSEMPTAADHARHNADGALREIRALRIVVKDLCYIVNELIQLDPRADQSHAAALRDHLDSIGWDNEDG